MRKYQVQRPISFWSTLTLLPLAFSSTLVAQPDDYPNTQKLEIDFTSAQKALSQMELPDGFRATLFASEPDIQQPIAVTTDKKGRLWVVECYTYSDRKTNYDMSMKDRVVIFEDTDNDGVHDKRTVFWDQGEKLTGIELGFGGVWLTSAPNFIFVPDRNHDDVPDGPPEILLDGFEDNVIRHNIVNGLRWGHDGWLYGRHGIQATSFVGSPGSTESQRIAINCSIWRFHPIDRKFEIVAQGGTNPWGFDFDEHGEMFMINTVIGHLFHVIPGARYKRMYGAHFNPHTYHVIQQTADHLHFASSENWTHVKNHGISDETNQAGGGHAHTGLMIYLGGKWPRKYHNGIFTANFHGLRINREILNRKGNGYVGLHAPDFMKTSDQWFRGVEMIYGPDGDVYLLDWSDIGECHENDGIHRTSGRIFKISYDSKDTTSLSFKPIDLASEDELVSHHFSDNEWYFRKARRELQERQAVGKSINKAFHSLTSISLDQTATVRSRLRAMWSLYSADQLSEANLLKISSDPDEHVRSWAVRLLCDGRQNPTDQVAERLTDMALDDPSGLVRLYIASGLNRFESTQRLGLAQNLLSHESDATDRSQPHLIWYGLEPIVKSYPTESLQIAVSSKSRLVATNLIRRVAFENEDRHCRDALAYLLKQTSDAETEQRIVEGMDLAFKGWTTAVQPAGWSTFAKQLVIKNSKESIERLNLVFGRGASVARVKAVAMDGNQDALVRSRAIESYAKTKPEDLQKFLQSLAGDKSVLTQVAKSTVYCRSPSAANMLINRFGNCDQDGKTAVVATLVSRPTWAGRLLDAVRQNRIPRDMVKAWHVRRIQQFEDATLNAKLAENWGAIRSSDEQKTLQMKNLHQWFTKDRIAAANTKNGQAVFEKNCANCHVMFGKGSRVGPDLTGSDRKNLSYLIENLIDPSSMVAESYQMKIYLLEDGRQISGLILSENAKTIELQTAETVITLAKDEIDEQRKTRLSLMPDGLLDTLSETDRRDLFGYLMNTK